MKKFLLLGVAALTFVGCSNKEDFSADYPAGYTDADAVVNAYNAAFINAFGQPAANQTWGFGTPVVNAPAMASRRAAFTDKWTNDHSCNWESVLNFSVPADAVDVTSNADKNNKKNYYVPAGYKGSIDVNFSDGSALYNYGEITYINGNYNGTVSIYNAGTIDCFAPTSGGRHTVYNTGTLTLGSYNNIGELYNGGSLVLPREHNPWWSGNEGSKPDIPNAMSIYSIGTIEMPHGGDLKAVCDIHGTLNVTGDVKIQNSTTKYICGIVATGKVENVDGPLLTSNIEANEIQFDGNPIYLLPGGHMNAKKTMYIPNSGCHVYGHEGSVALVEATNFEFGNKNDFTHTFSDNIYFKVNGGYVNVDNCYAMGQSHYFANVEAYLADTTHADEFALAAARINAGDAKGSPACGAAWSIGTPQEEEYQFLCRVFAEDLSVEEAGDFDFNDVVFDVYNKSNGDVKIVLQAAGGTLPLTINDTEVHGLFGVDTKVMVNTGAEGGKTVEAKEFELIGAGVTSLADVNEKIAVKVQKEGSWYTLDAYQGQPAAKFAIQDQNVKWCIERHQQKAAYPAFEGWVQTTEPANWWKQEVNEVELYTK